MTKKQISIWFLFVAILIAAMSGCATPDAAEIAAMSPEQLAAEQAEAEALTATGQKIAESGEWLPYPLNLIAAAGGTALIIVGGKKAAALSKTAAAKVIVPAVAAVASKILCREKGKCSPETETPPGGASEPKDAADLTDFDGNGRDGEAKA